MGAIGRTVILYGRFYLVFSRDRETERDGTIVWLSVNMILLMLDKLSMLVNKL